MSWAHTSLSNVSDALGRMMAAGHMVYSAAYIMPAPKLGFVRKHANHLALIKMMMDDRLQRSVTSSICSFFIPDLAASSHFNMRLI
ncbi:hypothetical protein G6L85_16845 [Agrobacterium rhizogenes]|nr:hypothetical protein [Rhizobium rhizogenes]NTI63180.1 hypothetical protein [Rhizobium rhizogenes]